MPQDLPRTCYFQVSYTCPIHNISYNVYSVLSTGGDGVSFTYHVYLTLHHTMYLPCSAAQVDCTWSCPACRHLTLPCNRPDFFRISSLILLVLMSSVLTNYASVHVCAVADRSTCSGTMNMNRFCSYNLSFTSDAYYSQ